jgi:hypothetical protein
MGVRAKVSSTPRVPIEVNVLRDRAGEYFLIRHSEAVDVSVLEVTPWNRHLLLAARAATPDAGTTPQSTFLCGRDERHWFVAAIPESAQARTVQEAKDALKPAEVWDSIRAHDVSAGQYDGRRNAAFLRQGEWFFLPRPWLAVPDAQVLHDEPIRRGAAKPHICQHLYRIGGQKVYVRADYPNGLTKAQYRALSDQQRQAGRWQKMVREARVFVKGSIAHPDHKTIWLPYWHQVVMNTETRSIAMRSVAFLD